MPRKTNPRANWVKPDYHSQNKLNSTQRENNGEMNTNSNNDKRIKLRTSLQTYHRLMHDATLNLDLHRVYIGYTDHVLGTQQMPLLNWRLIEKGGDIPMHHILYFALMLNNGDKLMLWHRHNKLDRLNGSGLTQKEQLLDTIRHTQRFKAIQLNQYDTTPTLPTQHPPKTTVSNIYNTSNNNNETPPQKYRYNNRSTHNNAASVQQRFRYLVVLDFEATCAQNQQMYPQEIIEWPAMIIDTSTNQILANKTFHFYIKPKHHPKLTAFCQNLTGITQQLIDTKGAKNTIESVLHKWNGWCFDNDLLPSSPNQPTACIVTCGDWDLKSMWRSQRNLISNNNNNDIDAALFHSWINVKHVFKRSARNVHGQGTGMMAMLRHLNLKHHGRHHSGIDDVKNICNIVISLLRRGAVFDYTMRNYANTNIHTDILIKRRLSVQHQSNDMAHNDYTEQKQDKPAPYESTRIRPPPRSSHRTQHEEKETHIQYTFNDNHHSGQRQQPQFGQRGLCKFYGAGYCYYGSTNCAALHRADDINQYEQDWLNGQTMVDDVLLPAIGLPSNFSAQRIRKQKYDYMLVLDLEGSEEIIELPCILIDLSAMREISRFHAWVRPTHWNQPGYIAKHKLNDAQYINAKSTAVSWPLALQRLNAWLTKHGVVLDKNGAQMTDNHQNKTFLCAICGNWDIKTQIVKQCNICKVAMPFYFNQWMNIKDFALSLYPQYETYQVKGMAPLLRTLNMQLYGTHHLGMDDTYNIARIIIRFAMDQAVFDYTASRYSWNGKVFYQNKRRVSRYHTSTQRNNDPTNQYFYRSNKRW